MKSRDFCFWLQGFFEMRGPEENAPPPSLAQMAAIRSHLSLVFKHEIDPSMGDAAHQSTLNDAHSGPQSPTPHTGHGGPMLRC
jgi:hypothetical protein